MIVEVVTLADGMCEKNCENSSAKISFWPLHEKYIKHRSEMENATSVVFHLFLILPVYTGAMYIHILGAILYLNKKTWWRLFCDY